MTLLLLDANVWLASRNNRERRHEAARRLVATAGRRPFAALDLTLYEVADIAVKAWRSAAAAQRITDLVRAACDDDVLRVDGELIARAFAPGGARALAGELPSSRRTSTDCPPTTPPTPPPPRCTDGRS